MTDVAAVASSASTNAGSGAANGGAAKGAGTALDGAFAAIFGAAGGRKAGKDTEGTDVKTAVQAKTGTQTLDTAQVKPDGAQTDETTTAETDPQAVLAEAGTKIDAAATPETDAKPRKPGTRRKNDTDQDNAQALALAGAFAVAAPNAQQVAQGKPQASSAVAGIQALKTAAPVATGVAAAAKPDADAAAAASATAMIKPDTDSGKPGTGKDAKPATTAATTATQPQPVATPAGNVVADAAGQPGGQAGDPRSGSRNGGRARDQDQPAASQRAANDDTTPTVTAGSLQDIMQSLPPVLQSQLGATDIAATSSLPTVSTGDQLSNQAIDMSVSGQWIDRMAQEIATLAAGTGHSSFQLSPPNLGKIQVDLVQSGGQTNVRIQTETDEATQRLRDGQSALEANARVASLSLGSVSIEKSPVASDSGRDPGQRQAPDSGTGQQQQQASAQAQGQSGQNRGGAGLNQGGFGAVMGQEQEADTGVAAGVDRASDPGVRFA